MEITFVRHAQSLSNRKNRWQGQSNSDLSDTGRNQAKALAKRLANIPFDRFIVSDLDRTRQTADALGRPYETSSQWREIDVGRWEGLTAGQVAEQFPEEAGALAQGNLDVKVGGGESWNDVFDRVDAAFNGLVQSLDENASALVVAHGGILNSLMIGLLGLRGRYPRPLGRMFNTSISKVRIEGGRTTIAVYNDSTHVAPFSPWIEEQTRGAAVLALVSGTDPEERDRAQAFHGRIDEFLLATPEDDYDGFVEGFRGRVAGYAVPHEGLPAFSARSLALPDHRGFHIPVAAGITHIVASSQRSSLADYNVGTDLIHGAQGRQRPR
ncbi:MAG: histidine phosphatase family protein [Myxococcales bacterium]|nr:histidine phosphatase family protein [Myxococcales bacterium]